MPTTNTVPTTPNTIATTTIKKAKCYPKAIVRTIERDLKATPKSKAFEGIAEEMTIVWPICAFDSHDHDLLTAFGKSQGVTLKELLGAVTMDWFETNRAEIEELSLEFSKAADTIETLTRKRDAALRQYEKTMALIGLMTVPTEETPSTDETPKTDAK